MDKIAIVDLETTGLDDSRDRIIEVGVVLWSINQGSMLECYSGLLSCEENAAQKWNGIKPAATQMASEVVWDIFASICAQADAFVAHQADFEQKFLAADERGREILQDGKLWICTIEDVKWWDYPPAGKSLIALALAHGVAVPAAHRAINDCLLLARVFERYRNASGLLTQAACEAAKPKAEFISLAPYEDRVIVKNHGFHFDERTSSWRRKMRIEEAEALPFRVSRANTT